MNTKLITLASVLLATATLASTAQAGGGVRLGFGGPLGTFVATPSHGGGAYAKAAQKKKAHAQQAARKPEKKAPRVAKAEPKAAEKTTAAKVTAQTTETATETTTEETSRVTGSSALIQGSIPAEEQTQADAATDAPSEATVTASTEGSETCKKFIPAIGTTVTVGCGE